MFLKRYWRFFMGALRFRRSYRMALTKGDDIRVLRVCIMDAFMARTRREVAIETGLMRHPAYEAEDETTICWEAPVVFILHVDGTPALGMSLEFGEDFVSIRQLQGTRGFSVPDELKQWPRIFVEACIEYARLRGLNAVRLYRAHTDLFYEKPYVLVPEGPEAEALRTKIRARMVRRYDGTAKKMGLIVLADWAEWQNPDRA